MSPYSISVVKKNTVQSHFFENETITQHGTKENIFPVEIAGRALLVKPLKTQKPLFGISEPTSAMWSIWNLTKMKNSNSKIFFNLTA